MKLFYGLVVVPIAYASAKSLHFSDWESRIESIHQNWPIEVSNLASRYQSTYQQKFIYSLVTYLYVTVVTYLYVTVLRFIQFNISYQTCWLLLECYGLFAIIWRIDRHICFYEIGQSQISCQCVTSKTKHFSIRDFLGTKFNGECPFCTLAGVGRYRLPNTRVR